MCWSSCEQLLDPAEARPPGPLSIVGRLGVVAEDPAGEVGQGDADARRAEVGDEDVAGVGPERELARRPAARARADVALGDQSAIDQLADAPRDDGPAEARPRDELRARPGAAEPDLVEDDDERVERPRRAAGRRPIAVGEGRRHPRPRSYACRPLPIDDFCT